MGFASKTTGWQQSLLLRDDRAAALKTAPDLKVPVAGG
jgi:hypothetical protein